MSTEVSLKGFFCALISLVLAVAVFFRNERETGKSGMENEEGRQKYLPYVPAMLLPVFFLLLSAAAVWKLGVQRAVPQLMGTFLGIFLQMSVYDMLLLLLLPFLRKRICARTCALLWLLPTYLYYVLMSVMEVPRPLWVIVLSERMVWVFFGIWFAGFSLVMIWKVASHLVFRRFVLKGAEPVTDGDVLEILRYEEEAVNWKKPKLRLVRCAHVSTPLTVGLFRRSLRIVLPPRAFSEEEYRLIFRHELVHIEREDAWSKFFLAFCIAVCWFNPFMWIAGRKSAEDLELSCDETVLLEGDPSLRRRYAQLLLKTAGDDRGFTTCLSSAASAMRYRLKAVMGSGDGEGTGSGQGGNGSREGSGTGGGEALSTGNEGKRSEKGRGVLSFLRFYRKNRNRKHSGALTVALLFFALSMSCGYVALAYGESTGREKIFQNPWPAAADLYRVRVEGGEYDPKLDSVDAEALAEYLMHLPMEEITGNYSFTKESRFMEFEFYSTDLPSAQTAGALDGGLPTDSGSPAESGSPADNESAYAHTGFLLVRLYDSFVKVSSLHGEGGVYYLPEGVDWDYLDSLCPPLPALEVELLDEGETYGDEVHPVITSLICKSDGEERVLKARDRQETDSGIYSYRPIGKEACLSFSMEPVSGVEVEIRSWDNQDAESLIPTWREKDGVWAFPLSNGYAHYTIRATFRDERGTDFVTEFYFNIGGT